MTRTCLLTIALAAGVVGAQTTDFDTGFEGWTSPNPAGMSWMNSGGNPNGYIRFIDTGPADGGQLIAPASYLGDWSAYDGAGTLSVDYKLFARGNLPFPFPSVRLFGPGGIAWFNGVIEPGPHDWLTMTMPIDSSSWILTSGTWAGLIANVTELKINMSAASTGSEITGIDNVVLEVPAPGGFAAILLAAAAVGARRRR